jgi:hypothetical protein
MHVKIILRLGTSKIELRDGRERDSNACMHRKKEGESSFRKQYIIDIL